MKRKKHAMHIKLNTKQMTWISTGRTTAISLPLKRGDAEKLRNPFYTVKDYIMFSLQDTDGPFIKAVITSISRSKVKQFKPKELMQHGCKDYQLFRYVWDGRWGISPYRFRNNPDVITFEFRLLTKDEVSEFNKQNTIFKNSARYYG